MWTKTLKIRTNNGELLLLSVGVPSLEAELAMSKGIKRYCNYKSSSEHAMQKIIYHSWEISEVWVFWQTLKVFCLLQ